MTRKSRRNHGAEFKAKVALAAVLICAFSGRMNDAEEPKRVLIWE
jgi:hypothetical protein